MPRRTTPPPIWFAALVAAALALALRGADAAFCGHSFWTTHTDGVQLAWWQFVLGLVGIIWDGVQVAYHVLLVALQWSVKFLWTFATATYNALVKFGRIVGRGLREAWEFTRDAYTHVLKPAWEKFWKFYDRVRRWLDRVFGPVLRFLNSVRTWITDFYNRWIRPFVDALSIARKVLGILARFGVDWARALDAKLAELEYRIQQPFRIALAKINELVNIVNRVITFDGLLQRLALLRSIERDLRYVNAMWWASQTTKMPADVKDRRLAPLKKLTIEQHAVELNELLFNDSGRLSGLSDEMTRDVLLALRLT